MELLEQITASWEIHNAITLKALENVPEEGMSITMSKRGGRDISRQFAHIHMVRVWRLESFAKKRKLKMTSFEKNQSPSKRELKNALEQSGDAMKQYIEHAIDNGGVVSNFKRGVVPMLGYYISHEAHHRGNILLTMKLHNIKLPDSLKWEIWAWNKIDY